MSQLSQQQIAPSKIAKKPSTYISFDYSSIRSLKNDNNSNHQSQAKMLPGLGMKRVKGFTNKSAIKNQKIIDQPKLLTTAKKFNKVVHEEQSISDAQISNYLGFSSFLNSREITPINPLANNHKRKAIASQKNKLNSISSELFDIQSNPEQCIDQDLPKYKRPNFVIFDRIIGQSEIVYEYVFGKQKNVNPKLIQSWKDCLSHQDKTEIYAPSQTNKINIPYTHPRIYPLNEIEKGLRQVFGIGKNRSLTIGEESIILESIQKYLKHCTKDPMKITRKDFDIIHTILTDCSMLQLEDLPYCSKQIETHFKLMATKWRYSGLIDIKDKLFDTAIVVGKNNFIDLGKKNILSDYLLKNSNINDF